MCAINHLQPSFLDIKVSIILFNYKLTKLLLILNYKTLTKQLKNKRNQEQKKSHPMTLFYFY